MLLGDFNVHFDCPEKSDVKRFKTSLDNIGLIQHVSQPTHRCGHILDLVITREDDSLIESIDVDNVTFTIDHYMINCALNMCKPKTIKLSQSVRKYRQIDRQAFSVDLSTQMCSIMNKVYTDVNTLLKDFNNSCSVVLDAHAPLTTKLRAVKHRPG